MEYQGPGEGILLCEAEREASMKATVIKAVLVILLATGAEASAVASYLCIARVTGVAGYDAEASTMRVTLDVLKVTEDLTGYGREYFKGYLLESPFSIELQGVSQEMEEGTLIEAAFVHVSGIMPPDDDGSIREYQSERWELKSILKESRR